ncbi:SRPBCC family protein [Pyxidicoccus trucidator]|uniref:SRPBCC family protein n=1 Tax=Pyxidicoccus trucidator TaxID=2709662 RepID=UPI0013DC8153|nr:SRPBCC family protein [Pyxidicoccus trucidator]
MAKLIGVVVVVLIVAVVLFIRSRPDHFRIERSAQIHAPPDTVFAMINDFHQWGQWSPYEKLDPNIERRFEGPSSGPGAVYAWTGNSKAGEGRMTILESRPGELVTLKLEFFKPFAATNQATFTLVPSGTGTRVTWSMEGENSLMGKAISAFMDMDALLGKNFEEGLANLNTAVQSGTEQPAQGSAARAAPALAL